MRETAIQQAITVHTKNSKKKKDLEGKLNAPLFEFRVDLPGADCTHPQSIKKSMHV
jgi:hypothetical protein